MASDKLVAGTEFTPESFEDLKRKEPSAYAGGVPAVTSAMRHIISEMGTLPGMEALMQMNQFKGFDCPGCAWPDPDDRRSVLGEYCENGAKALAEEATRKRVDPAFFATHSVQALGEATDFWLGKQGRITHPMVLNPDSDHYEPISWEDAFRLLGTTLNGLAHPDEAVFYTSGRTSNEAAFLYQLFVRMFGTNNLPDCSNMCHESSGQGLSQTVGIGKGSVTLEDIHEAEVVMVVGQNPGTNHPRMLSALQICKQRGGKVVTVNPLPEAGLIRFKHPQHLGDLMGSGTALSDLFLQVRVNGDIALAKALMILLFEAEEQNPGKVLDLEFIETYTAGFDALKVDLQAFDLHELAADSGVPLELIRETAQLLIQHDKIIICWAMGLTQHENGVANIQEMVNLLLLKGAIGRPGAGTCPVRGHSNVQGDRTMGIWEKPKEAFLDKLDAQFGMESPREHGHDVVSAIKAMHAGAAKVFFGMGGNFLSATPDTAYTAEALRNCELTVHVSTKLNRSHLVHGKTALILPCLARSERDEQAGGNQFVSVENSMGVVHASEGKRNPASEHLLSEPAIVAEMALATLAPNAQVPWKAWRENYDLVRDAIEAVIPGFDSYNQRVRESGGFYLPNGARNRRFDTPDGKAHFTVNALPTFEVADSEYVMMTIRSHDQYNTTIYGMHDRYRGVFDERRVIFMNPTDMESAGLKAEDRVHLQSHFRGEVRTARNFLVIPYDIPPRCTATYFPETNVLVPVDSKAEGSHTPTSKFIRITVEKA
ncbi:FdhF/YdeP family oxidoreductase [Pontibacter sp. G13]|uniref:FdhF/YdeP family oxidoreductase n=1 Tax=Pontibacter sp. G13 TaxID=3074898 RepID=UPI0028891910|nr:FdhF/YdeP family oxidoreductase [Pontibacter sp. G13]WNJ17252.1 FdhF/YdeP family oxidoreductase [Pontibacter sp. G13]